MSALFSYFCWCDFCLIWYLLGKLSNKTSISRLAVIRKVRKRERVFSDHRPGNESEDGNMLSFTAEILHSKKNVNTVQASEYHFSLETVLNRTEAIEICVVQVN